MKKHLDNDSHIIRISDLQIKSNKDRGTKLERLRGKAFVIARAGAATGAAVTAAAAGAGTPRV